MNAIVEIQPYLQRRARLAAQLQANGGGIAILPTAPEKLRNGDADYPYRHDSYFYYLSGFDEPAAVIVIVAAAGAAPRSILFCREKNPEREIWDGFRYGPDAACATFGFDAAFAIDALDTELPKVMANQPAVFYALGKDSAFDTRVHSWLNTVRAQVRSGVEAPAALHDVQTLLNDMRLVKDASEIALMRRAAQISAQAHARAMRCAQPGLHEYQIEAELLHEFRRHGSEFPAYTSIVATGANACVLHYRAGAAVLTDGDLVLIDAGCELAGYASDITRTFPANGKFSAAQKQLYEIVLAAQAAAIAEVKTGARFNAAHRAALTVLVQGMLDSGLLDPNTAGTLDDVLASGAYKQFYMHRTGHWLGMDVHDVGAYREPGESLVDGQEPPSRILHPGMVVTVEPGLYVRPAAGVPERFWNIGIRIEDDVLVTENGCDILSIDAPKSVAEIEKVMQR